MLNKATSFSNAVQKDVAQAQYKCLNTHQTAICQWIVQFLVTEQTELILY